MSWSIEEEQYLVNAYGRINMRSISFRLKKPQSTIRTKANRMGLSLTNTKLEDLLLVNFISLDLMYTDEDMLTEEEVQKLIVEGRGMGLRASDIVNKLTEVHLAFYRKRKREEDYEQCKSIRQTH